jgi:hypothetical protein
METFFYPAALALFLLALYAAQKKQDWSWLNIVGVAGALMLVTYSYTIGRLLGPLLAAGLVFFITSQTRLTSIVKTWLAYGLTLIPLFVFRSHNPEALTQRFYLISYIKQDSPWSEIIPKFIRRYFEDLSLINLLFDGDGNPRHHITDTLGSFLIAGLVPGFDWPGGNHCASLARALVEICDLRSGSFNCAGCLDCRSISLAAAGCLSNLSAGGSRFRHSAFLLEPAANENQPGTLSTQRTADDSLRVAGRHGGASDLLSKSLSP